MRSLIPLVSENNNNSIVFFCYTSLKFIMTLHDYYTAKHAEIEVGHAS